MTTQTDTTEDELSVVLVQKQALRQAASLLRRVAGIQDVAADMAEALAALETIDCIFDQLNCGLCEKEIEIIRTILTKYREVMK